MVFPALSMMQSAAAASAARRCLVGQAANWGLSGGGFGLRGFSAAVGRRFRTEEEKDLAPFSVKNLQVRHRQGPKRVLPPLDNLGFGQMFSELMCECDYDEDHGWYAPVIRPLENMSIHPGCTALHYAIIAFEGVKAHKSDDGRLLLFRPYDYMKRFNVSAERVALPKFDVDQMVEMFKVYARNEEPYIIPKRGFSLYMRPILFSTDESLGVYAPRCAKLIVMACPSGTYYAEGMRLWVETDFVRSWPGSAGSCKVAANYAPTLMPGKIREKQGYDQVLWTWPSDGDCMWTECGAMSIFMLFENESGQLELTTPVMEQDLILPGVTRDTVFEVSRELFPDIKCTESRIFMEKDFIPLHKAGKVKEVFATGTGALVVGVQELTHKGTPFPVPISRDSYSNKIRERIIDIQMGKVPGHKFVVEC